MMLSRVLLPEPDGPMSAANAPDASVRDTSSRARVLTWSPYSLTTLSTSSTGSDIADRRRRIETRRTPRREHGREQSDYGREQRRTDEQRRLELNREARHPRRVRRQ